jgi:hypothetical protein
LIRNGVFRRQLGKILCKINEVVMTLNQRVQGSGPFVPTKKFKHQQIVRKSTNAAWYENLSPPKSKVFSQAALDDLRASN